MPKGETFLTIIGTQMNKVIFRSFLSKLLTTYFLSTYEHGKKKKRLVRIHLEKMPIYIQQTTQNMLSVVPK